MVVGHRLVLWMLSTLVPSFALADASILIDPACPNPSSLIQFTATQGFQSPGPDSIISIAMPALNSIQVVASGSYATIGPSTPKMVTGTLGELPSGVYHLDFYIRVSDGTNLGPEQFAGYTDFEVAVNATTCAPWNVTVIQGAVQAAMPNAAFPLPVRIRVSDTADIPVAGALVHLERVSPSWDPASAAATRADATFTTLSAITDSRGVVEVNVRSNADLGSYQYSAAVIHANITRKAFMVLSNRALLDGNPVTPALEYFNGVNGHYFMTADSDEIAKLDSGALIGWARTGAVFLVLPSSSQLVPSVPVCRYYGRPEAGLDSHFFSASLTECNEVAERFASSWILESAGAFRAFLPEPLNGQCPPMTAALYRVYNNRSDVNHRYLTTLVAAEKMKTFGWIPEGYGPNAVAMCVAQ